MYVHNIMIKKICFNFQLNDLTVKFYSKNIKVNVTNFILHTELALSILDFVRVKFIL